MKPYSDSDHVDIAYDELAVTDPWDREFGRPSDFPSARAFLDATDRTSPALPSSAAATAPVLASSPREGGGRGLTSDARDRSGMQTGSGPTNPPREENS